MSMIVLNSTLMCAYAVPNPGVTLKENNLREIPGGHILDSQGVLVANRRSLLERPGLMAIVHELLERLEAHLKAEQVGRRGRGSSGHGAAVGVWVKRRKREAHAPGSDASIQLFKAGQQWTASCLQCQLKPCAAHSSTANPTPGMNLLPGMQLIQHNLAYGLVVAAVLLGHCQHAR
jgi:hypothetical protein